MRALRTFAIVLALLAVAPVADAAARTYSAGVRWANGADRGDRIGTISLVAGRPDAIRGSVRVRKGTWRIVLTLTEGAQAPFRTERTIRVRRASRVALPGFRRDLAAGAVRVQVVVTRTVGRPRLVARGTLRVRL
jgi:hypothetical protein